MPHSTRRSFYIGTTTATQLPSPSSLEIQSAPLNTTTAFIRHHPITILFDEGSQINMINSTLATRLHLPIQMFTPPIHIRGANSQVAITNTLVPHIPITIPASSQTHKQTHLTCFSQALVANSPFDLILGIPFIRHWNLVHHYCNNTMIYVALLGNHLTIHLSCSKTKQPWHHRNCPFIDICQPLHSLSSTIPNHISSPTNIQTCPYPSYTPSRYPAYPHSNVPHIRFHEHYSSHPHQHLRINQHPLASPLIHTTKNTIFTRYSIFPTPTISPPFRHFRHYTSPSHRSAIPLITTAPPLPPYRQPTITPHQVPLTIPQHSPPHKFHLQPPQTPPKTPPSPIASTITLCNPTQFMRHIDSSTTLYCVIVTITQSPSPHDTATDTLTCQFRQYALTKYSQLFPPKLPIQPPPPDQIQHSITLVPNHSIPKRKLYRESNDELIETKRQITEYLNAGHISPSISPFGALILLVNKKDNTIRMCVDYRGLNEITVKNTFPILHIDNLHDQLAHARYFTKLDLFTGYH